VLLSRNYHSFLPVLKKHPYKQCIIISYSAEFLKVSFFCISFSEFPAVTHNIPRMIIWWRTVRNSEINMRFFKHTVVLPCLY